MEKLPQQSENEQQVINPTKTTLLYESILKSSPQAQKAKQTEGGFS